jgi:hypothetical protein
MAAQYSMVHSDPKLAGIAVWDMTEPGAEPDNQGLQFLTVPGGAGTIQAAGTRFADVANLHNYIQASGQTVVVDNQVWTAESINGSPNDGMQGEYCNSTSARGFSATPQANCAGIPKVTTETSWSTARGITNDQQGKLATNLYLTAAKDGYWYTFWYLLFDEPQAGSGGFGLMAQSDGTSHVAAKASGTYLHNLTSILNDNTSAFTPVGLSYSVDGEPETGHDLLFEKSNGTYELAVWDDRPVGEGMDAVTVNLGKSYLTVNVYDITGGTSPVQTLSNASMVPLNLTDHALVVEFR